QDELPLIPRQELINLQYEKAKSEQEIANLRLELALHGLSPTQIGQVERGAELDLNLQLWQAILARNGIWMAAADRLLAALPEERQTRPWVIGTIGELITQDLLSDELVAWVEAEPLVAGAFIHVA